MTPLTYLLPRLKSGWKDRQPQSHKDQGFRRKNGQFDESCSSVTVARCEWKLKSIGGEVGMGKLLHVLKLGGTFICWRGDDAKNR